MPSIMPDESKSGAACSDGPSGGMRAAVTPGLSDTPRVDALSAMHHWTPGRHAFLQLREHYEQMQAVARELERELAESDARRLEAVALCSEAQRQRDEARLCLSKATSERDEYKRAFEEQRDLRYPIVCDGIEADIASPFNACQLRQRCAGTIELLKCERDRIHFDVEEEMKGLRVYAGALAQSIRDLIEASKVYDTSLMVALDRAIERCEDALLSSPQMGDASRCPTCNSPHPKRYRADPVTGICGPCPDKFHAPAEFPASKEPSTLEAAALAFYDYLTDMGKFSGDIPDEGFSPFGRAVDEYRNPDGFPAREGIWIRASALQPDSTPAVGDVSYKEPDRG